MLADVKTPYDFLVALARWLLITLLLVWDPGNNVRLLFTFCLFCDTHSFQDSVRRLFSRNDAQASSFFMLLLGTLFSGYCIASWLNAKKRFRPILVSYPLFIFLLLIYLLSLQIITSER
jgi:hypothetical protein